MSRDVIVVGARLPGRTTAEETMEALLLMREHFRCPLPDSERRHLQDLIETLLKKHGLPSRS